MTKPARTQPRIVSPASLAATAVLIGLVIGAAFLGRHDAHGGVPPAAPITEARRLRFADRADGAVIVTDASTGQTVSIVTGQEGFLRCTLSGLTRFRQANAIGRRAPFTLTLFADHRLTLADPATDRSIELEAFGAANEAVFAQFLRRLPAQAPLNGRQG